MANFTLTSATGDTITLTEGLNYKLIGVDQQTSASASLSTLVTGGIDGDVVNSSQANPRTIVLDIRIIHEVEATKRMLLRYIKLKQQATLTWSQNERALLIKGIVESIDLSRWVRDSLLQVSIHCSQPFWEAAEDVVNELREFIGLHYFTDQPDNMLYFPEDGIPFGLYDTTKTQEYFNDGDVAVGMEIEIVALDTCTNPIIYNGKGEYFGCGYNMAGKQIVMHQGDIIKIDTRKNQKSATLNGQSILGKIKPNSTWLQMQTGVNSFSFNSDEDSLYNMTTFMTYRLLYV